MGREEPTTILCLATAKGTLQSSIGSSKITHNKRMQSDQVTRYASVLAADARRYDAGVVVAD